MKTVYRNKIGRVGWLLVCLAAAVSLALPPAVPSAFADEAGGSDEAGLMATDISGAIVTGVREDYDWTGEAIEPVPTVTLGGVVLTPGTDYTVSYSDNVDEGTATVTVTGTGSYAGAVTVAFSIWKAIPLDPLIISFPGADRYETSFMINKAELGVSGGKAYKGVIVASGEAGRFADALSAAGLAGMFDYPIVLTNGSADSLGALSKAAIKKLTRGMKTDVIVVGGEPTVSAGIARELASYDSDGRVTRLGGADRYETNMLIYEYGVRNGSWDKDCAAVATGSNFADALGISGYAAAKGVPVFLVDPRDASLPDAVSAALESYGHAVALGGEDAVPAGAYAGIEEAVGAGNAERIAGRDRYETSAKLARWQLDRGMVLMEAGYATGEDFPDALASGFLLGKYGSALILVSPDPSKNAAACSLLNTDDGSCWRINVFGSEASVSQEIRHQIIYALGWSGCEGISYSAWID